MRSGEQWNLPLSGFRSVPGADTAHLAPLLAVQFEARSC